MRKIFLLVTTSLLVGNFYSPVAFAQDEEVTEVDQIEAEIENNQTRASAPVETSASDEKLSDFSGLGKLAPFSEISVIQKRFLPKTGRFQFFGGLANVVNDPWFWGVGFNGKLGYHFNETWGVELSALFLSTSERQTIKDLYKEHDVATSSLITTKGYYGAELVWTPIYGKMGLFNERIVPFDMYFSVGAGSAQVENGEGGAALHLGLGQIFAITKTTGFRWDFTWNTFSATPTGGESQNFNNLLLTFGLSFFFPEAKYR